MSFKLLLHIGMNKTGSTSIQEYLFRKSHGDNYQFIHFGSPNNSGFFQVCFIQDFHNDRRNRMKLLEKDVRKRRDSYLLQLDSKIRAAQESGTTCVMSAEVLSMLEEAEVEKIYKYFSKIFDEIQVLGFVRPPRGFITSSFQQKLKSGKPSPQPSDGSLAYRFRFEKFDKVFGECHCAFVTFGRASGHSDVVTQFFSMAGLRPIPNEVVKSNESLSLEAASVLYKFRQDRRKEILGKDERKINNRVWQKLAKFGSTKWQLGDYFTIPVLKQHAADISWIENRINCSLLESEASQDVLQVNDVGTFMTIARKSVKDLCDVLESEGVIAYNEFKKCDDTTILLDRLYEYEQSKYINER